MEWIQTFVIIFTVIGALGTFMLWIFSKLDSDIKAQVSRIDQAMSRIDTLYQMFVDLLKEKK